MKNIVWCAAMLIAGICTSCTGHPPRSESALGDIVSGGTAEEREFARAAFAELPSAVRDASDDIRITNYCRGFTSSFIIGFHHQGGPLCVREGCVSRAVIWHEPAHSHFQALPREAQQQWEEFVAADFFHGEGINVAIPGAYPSHGIITSYGGRNAIENYAEWVAWLTCYLHGHGSGYAGATIPVADRNDPVYRSILQFFRDHGVLTEEEFNRVRPLFAE